MKARRTISMIGNAVAAMLLVAPLLPAQEEGPRLPSIENAQVEKRTLTEPLATAMARWTEQAAQPRWIGYAVARIPGDREMCCEDYQGSHGNSGCGTCRLEGRDHGISMRSNNDTVKLEGPQNIVILFRAENKRVMKIRVVSEGCALDAGGLSLVWLTGVKPAESVALLSGYVRDAGLDDRHGALAAIAMHADSAADSALESFAQPQQPESLRRQTAFWLGEARGKAGLALLQKMAKSDPCSEVRAQVAFALSVSREPGALDEMIRMAKEDENAHVRGQALFWLAQKAGHKAVGTITGAIDNDPDTEVKKKAVFALSQLPKDEGIPKLILVAETNRNSEVRKQAMFWLGQSNDPRALEFFEKVLAQ
jgi:hypothetical protein